VDILLSPGCLDTQKAGVGQLQAVQHSLCQGAKKPGKALIQSSAVRLYRGAMPAQNETRHCSLLAASQAW
jgi:hypothetical protein